MRPPTRAAMARKTDYRWVVVVARVYSGCYGSPVAAFRFCMGQEAGATTTHNRCYESPIVGSYFVLKIPLFNGLCAFDP